MGGAFLTSREIFNHPIWKDLVAFRLFMLIYGNAVFSEDGVRVTDNLTLQRGQWLRSTRKLQEDLEYIENRQVKRYSTSTLNRTIKKLVKLQMICTKTHELGTVFTVVNYEKYQGFDRYRRSELGTELGTVTEQSQNNNNNVYQGNKRKRYIDLPIDEDEFLNIYNYHFQRKCNKQHPKVKEEQYERIMTVFQKLYDYGIDRVAFEDAVQEHFMNLPEQITETFWRL